MTSRGIRGSRGGYSGGSPQTGSCLCAMDFPRMMEPPRMHFLIASFLTDPFRDAPKNVTAQAWPSTPNPPDSQRAAVHTNPQTEDLDHLAQECSCLWGGLPPGYGEAPKSSDPRSSVLWSLSLRVGRGAADCPTPAVAWPQAGTALRSGSGAATALGAGLLLPPAPSSPPHLRLAAQLPSRPREEVAAPPGLNSRPASLQKARAPS